MYKIGMFSKMNQITIKALRHYDDIGIFRPAQIDVETGYRYYSSHQLPELWRIQALRQLGFSLEEIAAAQRGASTEKLLLAKRAQLLGMMNESTKKLAEVEHYLLAGKEGYLMNHPIVIRELPEVMVASKRQIIKNYDELFAVVPAMGDEMRRLGCVCAQPEYCFNIYHDGEYKESNIDVEICEAVVAAKENTDKVTFKTIPAVPTAACMLHKGPYTRLPEAYGALVQWMESNGYEPADNPRESYIDGVWNKDSEEEWLTEVQFPVQKKVS